MNTVLNLNSSSFLFYDYETFGIHPALDKPAQFACIRTDINFNIIDTPNEFFCYPPIDYLPDPNSILITGISPLYTRKCGLNEFEFASKICNQFMQPNTCIIGYNNIHFDDEITRNVFYRNFIDPYEWSWKNGNSRWDILDVLRACYALRPKGINWPKSVHNYYPSFKLSDISKSNGIVHDKAHSAISDVFATLQITKLLKKIQPKLFDYFFKYRSKKELLKIIDVYNIKPMIYVSRFFGSLRNNISYIAPILWDPNNSNILISVDLAKDIESLLIYLSDVTVKAINYNYIFQKGIVLIHINRCPILAPINVIGIEDRLRLNINYEVCKRNLFLIRSSVFLKNKLKIINYKVPKLHLENVDLQMYNAFFGNLEKKLIKIIHVFLTKGSLNRRALPVLSNRIKLLLLRCIARNYPHILNVREKLLWKKHCNVVVNSTSIYKYVKKILNLLELNKNDFKKVSLLKDLLKYVYIIKRNIRNI